MNKDPLIQPVIDYIKQVVPKPKELPTPTYQGRALKWIKETTKCGENAYSPMGLIPTARVADPCCSNLGAFEEGFNGFSGQNLIAFYNWWCMQTNAQNAVDSIWGV